MYKHANIFRLHPSPTQSLVVFSRGWSSWGVKLTTHLILPRLETCGSIFPFDLHAITTCGRRYLRFDINNCSLHLRIIWIYYLCTLWIFWQSLCGVQFACDQLKNMSTVLSWIKMDQRDVTCFIISLFNAQHVSDVNTSINIRVLSCLFVS